MRRKLILLGFVCCLITLTLQAARVDTIMVKSPSMNKEVEVVFVIPDKVITKQQACPVIYLLHGHGNNARCWITLKPELTTLADEKGLIFACPDGKASWYWDSLKDLSSCYETFISSELVNYTDANYATIPEKKARAISGLSMGGQGALWNAIRHKDVFGAAGSTSGGVDIRPFPESWGMKLQLGEYAKNKEIWDAHSIVNLVGQLTNGDLALIVDCGTEDFFFDVNKELHQRLLAKKIEHDFIVRPGSHNGKYWSNSMDYQILFFEKFFKR